MTKTIKLLLISTVLAGCQGAYDKSAYDNSAENKQEMKNEHHHNTDKKVKAADMKNAASPERHVTQHVKATTQDAANTAALVKKSVNP